MRNEAIMVILPEKVIKTKGMLRSYSGLNFISCELLFLSVISTLSVHSTGSLSSCPLKSCSLKSRYVSAANTP